MVTNITILLYLYTISMADPTSVKTVYSAFKINTKLRCLRFECFMDIHVMNRTLHDCLGARILSSRAHGTLEENIRAVMHNNIFHIFISLIIYLFWELFITCTCGKEKTICSYFD